jgi:hypothetical protein
MYLKSYIIKILKKIDNKFFNNILKNLYHKFNFFGSKKGNDLKLKFKLNKSQKKILVLSDLLNKSPLDGVIVECGVGIGFSLSILAKISKNDVSENDTVNMLKILKFSKKHYKLMSINLVKRNLLNNEINEKDIEN